MIDRQRKQRVYVDTSVFGGVFDDEFAGSSAGFFSLIRGGHLSLVTSGLVEDEILRAPANVQGLFNEFLPLAEISAIDESVDRLLHGYLDAGIVSPKWRDDALHVALATVSYCRIIVSWNFKHIVHFQKIPKYNAVNALFGYDAIAIYSPLEVSFDE